MLVADCLLFLLKIGDNLSETLFQNLDLVLVRLDLVCLHGGALLVLLLCPRIDGYIALDLPIGLLLPRDLLLVLLQLVALTDRLQGQALILVVDLALNRLDRYRLKRGKQLHLDGMYDLLLWASWLAFC